MQNKLRQCPICAYELDIASNVCPECGTSVTAHMGFATGHTYTRALAARDMAITVILLAFFVSSIWFGSFVIAVNDTQELRAYSQSIKESGQFNRGAQSSSQSASTVLGRPSSLGRRSGLGGFVDTYGYGVALLAAMHAGSASLVLLRTVTLSTRTYSMPGRQLLLSSPAINKLSVSLIGACIAAQFAYSLLSPSYIFSLQY